MNRKRDQQAQPDDAGLTLVEVIVGMAVFTVMATITAGLLINTVRTASANKQRVTAGNLVQAQIEQTRSLRTLDIPDGASTVLNTTVGGTTYTVNQTVNVVASDSSTSICSGSGNQIGYKLVTAVVTWTGMGSAKPVRADTLKALGVGNDGLDTTKGAYAVAVIDSNGNPQQGVSVMLNPGGLTRTTGIDGCAVYLGLTPTDYTVTLSKAGYVTVDGAASITTAAIGVRASTVTRPPPVSYDLAGSVAFSTVAPGGYSPVSGLRVTVSNTRFTPTTSRSFPDCSVVPTAPQGCVSGTSRSAAALFPGQYGAWAGSCADAAPTAPPNLTPVASGPNPNVTVALAGVRVQVQDVSGRPVPGRTLYAYHAPDNKLCTTPEFYLLNADGSSDVRVGLPSGMWTFALTPDASSAPPSGPWPTAQLAAGSASGGSVVVRTG